MGDLSGSTAGDYPDLDRFNRVIASRWTAYTGTDVDFFDVDITYDRNSNITRVEDNVHVGFDWSHMMDGLDRLSRGERGTWSGSITRLGIDPVAFTATGTNVFTCVLTP